MSHFDLINAELLGKIISDEEAIFNHDLNNLVVRLDKKERKYLTKLYGRRFETIKSDDSNNYSFMPFDSHKVVSMIEYCHLPLYLVTFCKGSKYSLLLNATTGSVTIKNVTVHGEEYGTSYSFTEFIFISK